MMDDDPDPVEEIRAIRRKIMRKYKTLDAYVKHLQTLPSAEEMHARIKAELERSEKKKAKPRKRLNRANLRTSPAVR